jgi:hypothetical protein
VESALALSSEFAKIIRQARKKAGRGKIFPLDQVKEDIIRKNPQLSGGRSDLRRECSGSEDPSILLTGLLRRLCSLAGFHDIRSALDKRAMLWRSDLDH